MKKIGLVMTVFVAFLMLSACGSKGPEVPVSEESQETTISRAEDETTSETETELATQQYDWENTQIRLINCASYIGSSSKKDYTSICFIVEMPDTENDEWMNEVPSFVIMDSSGNTVDGMGNYTMFEGTGALYRKNVEGIIEPGMFTIQLPDGSVVTPTEYADDTEAEKYKVYHLDEGIFYLNNQINSGTGSGSDEKGKYQTLNVIMKFENVGPDLNGKFNAPPMKDKLEMFMKDGTPMAEALNADGFKSGTAGETTIEFRFDGENDIDFRKMWNDYISKPGTYMEYTKGDGTKIMIPLFEG